PWRSELGHQLPCQRVDDDTSIFVVRRNDLDQRGPTEGRHAQKSAAKRRARFAFQGRFLAIPECKGTRYGPFARLRRVLEHEGIRRIETYCAQKLHARGPLVLASNQAG